VLPSLSGADDIEGKDGDRWPASGDNGFDVRSSEDIGPRAAREFAQHRQLTTFSVTLDRSPIAMQDFSGALGAQQR
jgi:hypothetical protein